MSTRRAGTLKRAKAVTEADEPHYVTSRKADDGNNRGGGHHTADDKQRHVQLANCHIKMEEDSDTEHKDNGKQREDAHHAEESYLQNEKAPLGDTEVSVEEPSESEPLTTNTVHIPDSDEIPDLESDVITTRRVSKEKQRELSEVPRELLKQDSIVSATSSSRGTSGHRVGTWNRRFANNRSVSFPDNQSQSQSFDREPSPPDKCQQYLELCMSILGCDSCRRRQKDDEYAQSCRRNQSKQDHDLSSSQRKNTVIKHEEEFLIPEAPFRKRCLRACMTFVYVLLVLVGGVVTYSMLQDLVTSIQNPVRSIQYNVVEDYEAPDFQTSPMCLLYW